MLSGKVALVTGGGQGVGQGIALALARKGAKVAVVGRTVSKCDATAQLIAEIGGKALAVECDVKVLESLQLAVQATLEEFGTIDILINNAQEVPLGPLNDVSEESFEAGWQSGPLATLRLMKLCHPHLKGGGSIVNLASTAAKRWDATGYSAYAAVKEAIRALTRGAASEWAMDGIRANVVLPHAKSPGLKWWIENNPEESAAFIATIPMGRVGECEEDIGRFVATLCSEECAYVNGQSIAVDGGQAYMG
ncbi:MAG TPA: SDR family oxidoreductase [Myxococcales bacterium]|jgi:NAD(P)-dependent dehydrogenase (short-subunit alcohol dehydrogenase family)|nr:SDR family oxidoreductase [Myxococcales bacterium]HIL80873.1 SDR family oxidoreductase [Myxococcales bacterium]